MKIIFHKHFEKHYIKLPNSMKEKFKERRDIFLQNQYDSLLNNHALTGRYVGCRSINITSDWRVIFEEIDEQTVKFVNIGTHSQLYG